MTGGAPFLKLSTLVNMRQNFSANLLRVLDGFGPARLRYFEGMPAFLHHIGMSQLICPDSLARCEASVFDERGTCE